mmetsp:Transcript_8744/g.22522  ORF Transcript_8744/g.22522 Transcript_8744/m.22522 type:complete len:216 (-) Transcript_8744:1254-1901(-)
MKRLGPDHGRRLHQSAQRVLVVAGGVALDVIDEVLVEQLLVLLDEGVLLEVRQVHKQRDEAAVVSAPALHAVVDGVGQLLHRVPDAAKHGRLEVAAGFVLHASEQLLVIELAEALVDILHLLGGLGADEPNERLLIRAPAIHGLLHRLAVRIEVERRLLRLEHADQGPLEVPARLALDVLNEVAAVHALVGRLDGAPLAQITEADHTDQLVLGCA